MAVCWQHRDRMRKELILYCYHLQGKSKTYFSILIHSGRTGSAYRSRYVSAFPQRSAHAPRFIFFPQLAFPLVRGSLWTWRMLSDGDREIKTKPSHFHAGRKTRWVNVSVDTLSPVTASRYDVSVKTRRFNMRTLTLLSVFVQRYQNCICIVHSLQKTLTWMVLCRNAYSTIRSHFGVCGITAFALSSYLRYVIGIGLYWQVWRVEM